MADDTTPIQDAATSKPPPYIGLVLYFADGTSAGGIWTGQRWWSQGRAVYPVRWRRLTPEPKTVQEQ